MEENTVQILPWEEIEAKMDRAAATAMKTKEQLENEANEIRAQTNAWFEPYFKRINERKRDFQKMKHALAEAK